MGTRADFYIGRGKQAEWIGSIAWDGHPGGFADELGPVTDETSFRGVIATTISQREDFTSPERGWPWPWEDSHTTDYAYCWDGESIHVFCFGRPLGTFAEASVVNDEDEDGELPEKAEFPNMKDRQNVTFGKRSGVIVLGG